MTTRRWLLGLLAAPLLAALPGGARAQEPDPAVAVVNGLYDGVKAVTAGGAGTVATRVAAITDTLAKTFDFATMARVACGSSRWRNIPAARQPALIETFSGYFTVIYANRLSAAVGSTFAVQPASEPRGEGRLVRSRVTDTGGRTTDVDYVIGKNGRVTDVYLAGTVSEVGVMRSDFEAPLKAGGADALEAFMRGRINEMLSTSTTPG